MIIIDTLAKIEPQFMLVAICQCGHHRELDIEKLIQRLGPDFPIQSVRNVMRCSKCGERCSKVQYLYNNLR